MISAIENVKIDAVSATVPKDIIDNIAFGKELFGDALEGLLKAIGVKERHVCINKDLTSLDLAIHSAKKLLQKASINKSDIGSIVFVTLTPDNWMPNNSSLCQEILGLDSSTAVLDINHACSGYVYGLWISMLIAQNTRKKVLLLDGDTNSYYVSPKDKATALLFGDAGTATLVGPCEKNVNYFSFHTDGSRRHHLIIPSGGYRKPLTCEDLSFIEHEDGNIRRNVDMEMHGQEVFNYVVMELTQKIKEFMDHLSLTSDDIDQLILHQANAFMLRQVARKLGFSKEKLPISIDKFGNTSSASIPLNICSELGGKTDNITEVIMAGFGAGFSTCMVKSNLSNILNCGVDCI